MNKKILENILKKEFSIYGTSNKIEFEEVIEKTLKRNFKTKWEGDNLKKIKLSNIFTNVRSYIAVGIPYPRYYPKLENRAISSYTTISDYHMVLIKKLKNFVSIIKDIFRGNYKIFVDSSVLFEKELAVSADLGFWGKNTLVINKEYGSLFFIGIILTDIKLPTLSSHTHIGLSCRDCNRCKDVCPNNALEEDYTLKVQNCISYITTDKNSKGNKENYIWGCDLCQIVCPFNIKRKNDKLFNNFKYEFNVKTIESKSKKEFFLYSKNLPLKWRGFKTFKENL